MLEKAGKMYARVSEVLRPFVDFSGIDPVVLQKKADLGTRIHEFIKDEIEGNFPVVVGDGIGYFKSFERWRSSLCPVFRASEQRIYNDEMKLTGCIDALVEIQGEDVAVLVDWKTSVNESPVSWPMQAHLYNLLLKGEGIEVAPRFLFIKLDRWGGLPKVYQYKFDPITEGKCLKAIDFFWAQNDNCC